MTKEEIKQYLKENLSIRVNVEKDFGGGYLKVELKLGDDELCQDSVSLDYGTYERESPRLQTWDESESFKLTSGRYLVYKDNSENRRIYESNRKRKS